MKKRFKQNRAKNGFYEAVFPPILLWAGDLDRDRQPDFLIDMTNKPDVSRPILFLSSLALPERLVEPAAQFEFKKCQ